MSYNTIAEMQADYSLTRRITAAAAEEQKTKPYEEWVSENLWDIVASPGWAAKWEYAELSGVTDIGRNPTVITDADILAAVQPLAPESPAHEPEPEPEVERQPVDDRVEATVEVPVLGVENPPQQ